MAEIQNPVMKRSKSEKEALFSQVIEMMAIPGKSGEESLISQYIQMSLLAASAIFTQGSDGLNKNES